MKCYELYTMEHNVHNGTHCTQCAQWKFLNAMFLQTACSLKLFWRENLSSMRMV